MVMNCSPPSFAKRATVTSQNHFLENVSKKLHTMWYARLTLDHRSTITSKIFLRTTTIPINTHINSH